ncbi:hypothetical protein [Candidatus Regiella insecticola]|uniref:hypothetical protein n=1 Tax=Candidatus Regiella insecticola TaxID=138073 RepID=UPI00138AFE0F|nr:hypothetical protein [Candidatus Regiella insecticola]
MIQGGGAQTVQIVRQVTTTQNQIKLLWLYHDANTHSQQRGSFKDEEHITQQDLWFLFLLLY